MAALELWVPTDLPERLQIRAVVGGSVVLKTSAAPMAAPRLPSPLIRPTVAADSLVADLYMVGSLYVVDTQGYSLQ